MKRVALFLVAHGTILLKTIVLGIKIIAKPWKPLAPDRDALRKLVCSVFNYEDKNNIQNAEE